MNNKIESSVTGSLKRPTVYMRNLAQYLCDIINFQQADWVKPGSILKFTVENDPYHHSACTNQPDPILIFHLKDRTLDAEGEILRRRISPRNYVHIKVPALHICQEDAKEIAASLKKNYLKFYEEHKTVLEVVNKALFD